MFLLGAYLVARPSNDGREDSTGSVISSKSSLDQARAIVAHKGSSLIVVTHDEALLGWSKIWWEGLGWLLGASA